METCGSSKILYTDRLKIFQNIFIEYCGIFGIKLIDVKCNVTYITSKLLKDFPLVFVHFACKNKQCESAERIKKLRAIMLKYQYLIDICNIERTIRNYVQIQNDQCRQSSCNGQTIRKTNLQKSFIY